MASPSLKIPLLERVFLRNIGNFAGGNGKDWMGSENRRVYPTATFYMPRFIVALVCVALTHHYTCFSLNPGN
ncbi:MAG: hypothetical protein ACE5OZ_08340 [Candidatus Heimdallarchaeota archaeon]